MNADQFCGRPLTREGFASLFAGFLLLPALLGCVGCSNSLRVNHPRPVLSAQGRHVLVISVDGLSAEFLARALQKGRLPNIGRLKSEGSSSEGVTGTYPSLTAPAHTTIVTGKLPADSGIYTYACFSQGRGKHRVWTSKDIRVPALWDRAGQAHLTSAAISWPLANDAPITWNLTGVLDTRNGYAPVLKRLAKWASIEMMAETIEGLGEIALGNGTDALRARLAIGIMKKYKPNLLLLHLNNLHPIQHDYGVANPRTIAALERVDGYIGDLLAEVKASGLEDTTDVFVVSGHGFESYDLEIEPNVLLAKAGLLTLNEDGKIIGGEVRTVANEGSFFIYWPESEDLRGRVNTASQPLRQQGLVRLALERHDLAKLGADPRVQIALEAHTGTIFGKEATGALTRNLKSPHGSDGYLPSRPEMQAVFLAAGPDIRAGLNLHQIPITSICSTILKCMGIDDAHFGHHLAIFVPGCCSEKHPVWSQTGTSGAYLAGRSNPE